MEKLKKFSNNEVTHIKEKNVEYLTFNALEKFDLKQAVTLRYGGVSEGVYGTLNFRTASNDKKENIFKNLEILCDTLNIKKDSVCKARQDHTDNILVITDENKEKYEFGKLNDEAIDGYITNSKNVTLMVVTADCNAIILYDTKTHAVGAVHSGWKGTTKRIYLKAIDLMKKTYGTQEEDLIICVSPSISKCCFSSEDENFKKIFTDIWKDEENYIYYENEKRFHIDLSYVITKDLIEKGVNKKNIHFAGICTCCNNKDFYSFRHKTMAGEEDYGLMATVVKLM